MICGGSKVFTALIVPQLHIVYARHVRGILWARYRFTHTHTHTHTRAATIYCMSLCHDIK